MPVLIDLSACGVGTIASEGLRGCVESVGRPVIFRRTGLPEPPPSTKPTYKAVPSAATAVVPRVPPPAFTATNGNCGVVPVSVVR